MSLNGFVKTPVEVSLSYYLESFVIYQDHPSAPLWFLATLTVLMLLYPLYKWLCKSAVMMVVMMLVSVAFYYADTSMITNVFNLNKLNNYLVFFFFGILFFRYKWYQYLDSLYVLIGLLVVYSLLYVFKGPLLLTSIVGIVAMCAIGIQVSKVAPRLFSSFRDNIYQIYLLSLIFQAFVELILWKKLFYNEHLFWLFYVANIAAGVFMPVVVTKIVKRCPWRVVRLCFGLS